MTLARLERHVGAMSTWKSAWRSDVGRLSLSVRMFPWGSSQMKHILRRWKDRKDNPAYWWQLDVLRRNVRQSVDADVATESHFLMEGSFPDANEHSPILLTCCDEHYFYRFARQLLISVQRRSPLTRTHIHIYDPSTLCRADAEVMEANIGHLTISYESSMRNPYTYPTPFFFAAARFAVANFLQERTGAPIMLVDTDGFVLRDLAVPLSSLQSYDLGVIKRNPDSLPFRRVLASAVFFGTSKESCLFARRLSNALRLSLADKPNYHVDQAILYYMLVQYESLKLKLAVTDLPITWGDHNFQEESLIWSAKGRRKREFSLLNLAEARAFARDYSKETCASRPDGE